jgi:hypothetical protein
LHFGNSKWEFGTKNIPIGIGSLRQIIQISKEKYKKRYGGSLQLRTSKKMLSLTITDLEKCQQLLFVCLLAYLSFLTWRPE